MLTENISSAGLSSVLDELVNITSISEEEDSDLFSGELEEVTKYLDVVARLADSDLPPSEEQSRVKDKALFVPECVYFTLTVCRYDCLQPKNSRHFAVVLERGSFTNIKYV